MANDYSVDDLLDFLSHASERGLMPAATAQALAVACRNVFAVLDAQERIDVRKVDIDAIIKRFTNKRAKEFTPSSLKEYGRRVRRAVELFLQWRDNPAEFTVQTRATSSTRTKDRSSTTESVHSAGGTGDGTQQSTTSDARVYQSAFPVRPGRVVTISNIPTDMSLTEAERLAEFIKMLAVE